MRRRTGERRERSEVGRAASKRHASAREMGNDLNPPRPITPEVVDALGLDDSDHRTNAYARSALKMVVGMVPLVGSVLTEAVEHIIPDSRMRSLLGTCQKLERRVREQEVSVEALKERVREPADAELLQDALLQAERARSDERQGYIATLLLRALTDEERRTAQHRFILSLLNGLSDEEVIILRLDAKASARDEDFRRLHGATIEGRRRVALNDSLDKHDGFAVYDGYAGHLRRLGLMDESGKVTTLGRLLLRTIGLLGDNER